MENLLRLIVIDEDINDAEMMISRLKSAGFVVRPDKADNEEELQEKLRHQTPDLVICSLAHTQLSLEKTVALINRMGRRIPVIALAVDDRVDVVSCLELGAQDRVHKSHPEHLKRVVGRTLEGQKHWRQMKKLESALREAERRCKTLLDSSRDAISYVHEGMHIYVNASYLELFGYTDMEDIEGMPLMDLVANEEQKKLKEFLRNYDKAEDESAQTTLLEIQLRNARNEKFPAEMEFSPASIDGENCTQILIRNQNTNARQLEKQLNYLSQRDLVTGLYNRQYFIERCNTVLDEAAQGEGNASLAEIRIDGFNIIREQVGVAASDLVLNDIGKILERQCQEERGELVARFEGETFAILLRRWEQKELESFYQAVLQAIANHICDVEGRSITCTVSVGVAQLDENTPDINELLSRTQKSVTQAIKEGGNRLVIYQPKEGEMTQKQLDELWNARISDAIRHQRMRLNFQPIISLHGEGGERYEVFMRMMDDKGELIAPNDFLPSAERSGMAKALDRWVLTQALDKLAEQRHAGKDSTFFIKITAGSLQDPLLLNWLNEKLKEKRIPAPNIVLEMRETTALAYLKQAKEFCKGLKTIQCAFALEEFGGGLNPFQILNQLSVDYLKIDHHFMHKLADSKENQGAIQHITDTAHSLNKLVIAPHIEDAATLSVLWGIGVNYVQGNFMQPPSEKLDYDFSTS